MKDKLFGKIFTAIKTDRFSDAARDIDKLIEKNPDNPNNYIKKGDVFQKNGNIRDAIDAYHNAADILTDQGFVKKALIVYKIITRIAPGDKRALESINKIIPEIESSRPEAFAGITQVTGGLQESIGDEEISIEPEVAGSGEAAEIPSYGMVEIEGAALSDSLASDKGADVAEKIGDALQNTSGNEFFSPFSADEVRQIFERAEVLSFNNGNMVVTEGDIGDSLYVIKEGRASVISHVLGRSIRLAELSSGDVFGEVAFLTGRPRTASIIADGHLQIYEINRMLIEEMVEKRPEIMEYLNEIYHTRVKETLRKARGKG